MGGWGEESDMCSVIDLISCPFPETFPWVVRTAGFLEAVRCRVTVWRELC